MNELDRFLSRYGVLVMTVAWLWSVATLLLTGAYTMFLRPGLGILLVLGLVVLMGFLISEIHRDRGSRSFGLKGATRMLILIAPLAYLSLTQGASLDSRAFAHRWTGAGDPNARVPASLGADLAGSLTDTNKAEDVNLVDLSYNPDRFINQKIAVEGMIHQDPKLSEKFGTNACLLFRFVVTCCAADARPVAALLLGNLPDHWPDDTWIRAEGRFILCDDNGQPVPTLEINKATRIPKPKQPYLY